MTKHELSVGLSRLQRAIVKICPELSPKEVERLSNILLEEIAKRIDAGDSIAFFRQMPGGKIKLTTLGLKYVQQKRGYRGQ